MTSLIISPLLCWLTRVLSLSITTIVADKGSFSSDQAYVKKWYSPGSKIDLHHPPSSPPQKIPTNQPYLQTQGQVTANEQVFKSSLKYNFFWTCSITWRGTDH